MGGKDNNTPVMCALCLYNHLPNYKDCQRDFTKRKVYKRDFSKKNKEPIAKVLDNLLLFYLFSLILKARSALECLFKWEVLGNIFIRFLATNRTLLKITPTLITVNNPVDR